MREREGWIEWRGHRTWFRIVGDLDSDLDPLPRRRRPRLDASLLRSLERLAVDGRAVVVYDQLGCGRSDRPVEIE